MSKTEVTKNYKSRDSYAIYAYYLPRRPTEMIALNFGVRRHSTDIISAKFYVDWFKSF